VERSSAAWIDSIPIPRRRGGGTNEAGAVERSKAIMSGWPNQTIRDSWSLVRSQPPIRSRIGKRKPLDLVAALELGELLRLFFDPGRLERLLARIGAPRGRVTVRQQ
jgi:hypothetical protein